MDLVPPAVAPEDGWAFTAPAAAGRGRRRAGRLPVVVFVLGLAACSPSGPPLSGAEASAADLARAVLSGIETRDERRLRALAVTEQEFRDQVWPRLPAARPERNLPVSYVWGDLRQKSELGLQGLLVRHGGRRFEVLGVRFEGDTDYVTYRVHRKMIVRVRDATGAASDLRVSGSLIEKDGAWKVFSYIVDD